MAGRRALAHQEHRLARGAKRGPRCRRCPACNHASSPNRSIVLCRLKCWSNAVMENKDATSASIPGVLAAGPEGLAHLDPAVRSVAASADAIRARYILRDVY